MGESRNRVGSAYSLTVFAPIAEGRVEAVRQHIDALPLGAESPLARLDTLHLSRLQIIDHLVYQGPPQRPDRLRRAYLVFTSTIDGELDPYLDQICERIGPDADGWWGDCDGYPGTGDRAAFRRWIREHQIPTSLFASAFPRATVRDIRESLALRERFVEFAASAQGVGAEELRERFLAAFAGDRS